MNDLEFVRVLNEHIEDFEAQEIHPELVVALKKVKTTFVLDGDGWYQEFED